MDTDVSDEDIVGTSSSCAGVDMSTEHEITVINSKTEECPNQEILCSGVTVYEGENAEFSCKVCHEDEEVSWFINNSEAIGERIQVSSHGLVRRLVIKDVKLSENGTLVTMKVGDKETTLLLEVKGSVWTNQLKTVTVYEGETAKLSCEVKNESVEIFWTVNNCELSHDDPYEVKSDGCVRQLLIYEAKLNDTDIQVTAKAGDQITTGKVVVKASHFLTQISDVLVVEGDTAVFSCEVRNVTDSVQWFINGNAISNDVRYTETKDGRERELRIHHCTLLDNETHVYVDVCDEERMAQLYVGDLEENKRRWLTVGVALNTVLCIPLRKYIHRELYTLWQSIESTYKISRQSCPPNWQYYRATTLNYQAINGNESQGKQFISRNTYNSRYDFTVRSPIDFAKLFLPSHMSHMTGFDNTCDISAAFNLICGTGLSAKNEADQVREEVRNHWGHCNFKEWGSNKLKNSFSLMCVLVKKLGLDSTEEEDHLRKLEELMKIGPFLFDGTCGITLVQQKLKKQFLKEVEDLIASSYDINIKKSMNMCLESINMRLDNLEKQMVKVEKAIHDHIPAHIKEQFEKRKDEWISHDEMFVSTHAAKQVMTKIKEKNFVVVTGNSGTGKTFLVRHTALLMEKEGYVLVPSVNPEDISKYFKHGCKTVFVFDDLCGRFNLNQNYLDQWKLHKQSLDTILTDDCCKIIASCRLQVFIDKHMTDFISDINGNVCELGSRSLLLSPKERRKLVKKYLKTTIHDENISEYEFLPFLCSMLKQRNLSEIDTCFRNPFYFFKEEFEKLYLESDEGKLKYSALIICVLCNNNLTEDKFKKSSHQFKSMLRDVLRVCKLSKKEPWQVQDALENLKDVFIVVFDKTYKIIHDKLFDFVAKYFGEKMIDLFIEYADSNLLAERLCITSMNTSYIADFIEVPDDRIIFLVERLVTDWLGRKVNSVFRNTNMNSVDFRQRFLSYLKGLDESLQRKLVQTRNDENGATPLLLICFYGDLEFADWTLKLGADVNLGSNDNTTPLHIACQEGCTDLVVFLLNYEQHAINYDLDVTSIIYDRQNEELVNKHTTYFVDVNKSTEQGVTPLMEAVYSNNQLDIVKELLKCEHINIDLSSKNGYTALHLASIKGNAEIVTELIQHSADINKSDNDGESPLIAACIHNHLKVVKELLKCGRINNIDHCTNNGCTALYVACAEGCVDIVTDLIQHSADINKSDKDGESPLIVACRNSHLEVVKELLKYEHIDIDHVTNNGSTAFYLACGNGNAKIVTELVQHSVDINKSSTLGFTPLIAACYHNHLEVVKKLLMCQKLNFDKCDINGRTALHIASEKGNAEIVTELVQHSADIDKSDKEGVSPLTVACYNNHLEVVKNLLVCQKININKIDILGQTALFIASEKGNAEIVTELIQHAASTNKSAMYGISPLMAACKNNHINVIEELLRVPATDVYKRDLFGYTALFMACEENNESVVSTFLKHSVDINRPCKGGWTPLIVSCYNNNFKSAISLLQCKEININHRDVNGQTALYLACKMGNVRIVIEVIRHKADINLSDENQVSPLFIAIKNGHAGVVSVLLEYGVDINKPTLSGWSPLMIACYMNNLEIAGKLLNCEHIDINQGANDGETALTVACKNGNVDIVTELLKYDADINRSNKDGCFPLMMACSEKHVTVVKTLLQCKGIDINNSDNVGCTALFVACVLRGV